jgi:hypothetical protein
LIFEWTLVRIQTRIMLFTPETSIFAQLSHLFMSQISIRERESNLPESNIYQLQLLNSFIYSYQLFRLNATTIDLIPFFEKPSEGTASRQNLIKQNEK